MSSVSMREICSRVCVLLAITLLALVHENLSIKNHVVRPRFLSSFLFVKANDVIKRSALPKRSQEKSIRLLQVKGEEILNRKQLNDSRRGLAKKASRTVKNGKIIQSRTKRAKKRGFASGNLQSKRKKRGANKRGQNRENSNIIKMGTRDRGRTRNSKNNALYGSWGAGSVMGGFSWAGTDGGKSGKSVGTAGKSVDVWSSTSWMGTGGGKSGKSVGKAGKSVDVWSGGISWAGNGGNTALVYFEQPTYLPTYSPTEFPTQYSTSEYPTSFPTDIDRSSRPPTPVGLLIKPEKTKPVQGKCTSSREQKCCNIPASNTNAQGLRAKCQKWKCPEQCN